MANTSAHLATIPSPTSVPTICWPLNYPEQLNSNEDDVSGALGSITRRQQKQRRDVEKQKEPDDELRSLQNKIDTLTANMTSMKSQLENCERDKDMLKAKLTTSKEDFKIETSRHKQVREELQKMKQNLKYIETQYADNGKLKERMQKFPNDNYKGSNISLTLINPAPESSTLPTKSKISKEEEMYHEVFQDYEERERELLAENQSLRQFLTNLYQEIVILLCGQVATFSAPIPSESGNNLSSLPCAPIPAEVARFQMPFNMMGEHIEEDLKALLAMLKEKLQGREQEIREKDEEIAKQRKGIEDLSAQLEEKKFVFEEQDKVIDHFLSGNFFQDAGKEVQLNMSGMELTIHETDEQTESLHRMRQQLDEERRRFTENTIKLGWDRVALRAERDAFEEEKRSRQTRTMLLDLEEKPSPNSRSSMLDSGFFSSLEHSSNSRSQNNQTPFVDLSSVVNTTNHGRPAAPNVWSKNEEGYLSTRQTPNTTGATDGHSQYFGPALRTAVTSRNERREVTIADDDMFQSPSAESAVRAVKHPRLDSTDESNIERRESIARGAKALVQTRVTRRGSVTSTSMKEKFSNSPSSTVEQRSAKAKMQQLQMANVKYWAKDAVSPSPAVTSSRSLAAIASKAAASAVNSPRRPPARVSKLVSLAAHSHNTTTMMLHTSSNPSEEQDASSESANFVKRSTLAKRATSMEKAAAQVPAQAQAARSRPLRPITTRVAMQ